jgi:GTPase
MRPRLTVLRNARQGSCSAGLLIPCHHFSSQIKKFFSIHNDCQKYPSLKPSAPAAAMRRFLLTLRPLTPATTVPTPLRLLSSTSAAAPSDSDSAAAPPADTDFDSADYDLPTPGPAPARKNAAAALRKLRFDPSIRARADAALLGKKVESWLVEPVTEEEEERSRDVAFALLEAAMEPPDEDGDEMPGEVREEDQMSLSVGIVGAPNAGKSSLTNTMVRMT